jgi:hypothetical protein
MKYLWIDTEGWFEWLNSAKSVESELEWIDISEGEYAIYDENGYFYSTIESKKGINNFIIKKSDINYKDFDSLMNQYIAGEKINDTDLSKLRGIKLKNNIA